MSIIVALLLFSILIIVHEAGHFFAARACGIAVNEFAIGFGPKLIGWKSRKHDTKFSIRLLPIGGFCSFYGEDDVEGKTRIDLDAYSNQPVWKRIITIFMGPAMNFVLAFALLMFYYTCMGVQVYQPYVYDVEENSPAAEAGLLPGDIVVTIDGVDVLDGTTRTFISAVSAYDGEHPLQMMVRREGEKELLPIQLTPFWDKEESRYRVGTQLGTYEDTYTDKNGVTHLLKERLGLMEALDNAWYYCGYSASVVVDGLKSLFTTPDGINNVGGPIAVVSVVSSQVRSGAFSSVLALMVMISINLGIANLLPIPGLDGSRLIFGLIEWVRGKPIPMEKEAIVHLAGMALLLAFMIFITFRDVLRLFQ